MTLAEEYARQRQWRAWPQVWARLPLRSGDVVVDLGCAIGDQAEGLAARGARVLGVDGNAELIAAARQRAIPGTTFVEADLRTWSDASLSADGLWCSFACAYFTELEPVLRRWTAALRPGAWEALVEIDDLFGHEPLSATTRAGLQRYCDEGRRAGRYDFRMGRRLAECATAAGLEVVEQSDLPDAEFAFTGAAAPEVIAAWALRLSRMPLLHSFFGAAWGATRDEFLACLADPAHRSTARVVFVLARTPGPTSAPRSGC